MSHDAPRRNDPQRYWAVLGLKPGADQVSIKAAFRRRAMELHPDRNPSPQAREEFQRLNEAYQILSDPIKRKVYESAGSRPAGPRKPRRRPTDPAEAAQAYARQTQTQTPSGDTPVSCRGCGKIPAQPRYVVLPTVQGRLWRSVQGTVEGVYCRRCADGAALATALSNWVFGWWSLPLGPVHTVSALLCILRGGRFPKAENFHILIRQSRAFLARQERELARGVALQARAYATSDDQRRLADAVLRSARDSRPARSLKNRWLGGSWMRTAQFGPPATVAVVLLAALGTWTNVNLWGTGGDRVPTFSRPPPAIAGVQRPLLLRTGQVYEVTVPRLPLHEGPDESAEELMLLDGGTLVLVTENAPTTGWVRILTADGDTGFVAGRYLTPGLPQQNLDGTLVGRGVTDGTPAVSGPEALRRLLGGGVTDAGE